MVSGCQQKSIYTMKTTQQPQLPFSPAPINWLEPQTVRGSELAQTIARANAAGFLAHRMTVLPFVTYELIFFHAADQDALSAATGSPNAAGKPFREPVTSPAPARTYGSPEDI
jgi:hypothetical protein